ncbi:MAG: Coenzyme F420 hydrogenase/dehydrogenase, beta subunit C-terminal domain [Planctomycetota bacterium]|jgi:coenzyme F420 hydrogenase subunit beta
MKKLERIEQVVEWRLCAGCGACAPACPEKSIRIADVPDRGIRPHVDANLCKRCGECLKVCPGIEISHQPHGENGIEELALSWGPVLEMWEGYAADPEIRFEGGSGGAVTALALYCLEDEDFAGVLHIGVDPDNPIQNVPAFSTTREQLIERTGARYSPAAPCERFDLIEESSGECVFVGKPCDVVALRKSQEVRPRLSEKTGLAISIFCAATPTTAGTDALLQKMSITADQVEEFRYRGRGWPGLTTARLKGQQPRSRKLTYEQSWGEILNLYRQFRCRLCPDSTGEFADIACGDPWYRRGEDDDPGRSLIIARTARGREFLRRATEAGYLELEKAPPEVLPASQKSLLRKRRHLFGRLVALKILRIPTPRFKGFSLLRNWIYLPTAEKLKSIGGTIKRAIARRWTKPIPRQEPPKPQENSRQD